MENAQTGERFARFLRLQDDFRTQIFFRKKAETSFFFEQNVIE